MKNTKENEYLYYVDRCYDFKKQIKEFYPKIPLFRMSDEDCNTPRICLGTSLDSCFSAASFVSEDLEYQEKSIIYCLYVFDKKDILLENFYNSDYLFYHKLVPDAYLTKECWVINQNLKPYKILYFTLTYFHCNLYPLFETIEEYFEYENGKLSLLSKDGVKNITCIENVEVEFIDKNDICTKSILQISFDNLSIISKNQETLNAILYQTLEGFECTYQVIKNDCSLWIVERENQRPFSEKKLKQNLSEMFESNIEII